MLRSNICVLNQYSHLNNNQTGECKMDPGGYFIINGSEKTVIGQERAAENQIYSFLDLAKQMIDITFYFVYRVIKKDSKRKLPYLRHQRARVRYTPNGRFL